jgi:hypothetical protein
MQQKNMIIDHNLPPNQKRRRKQLPMQDILINIQPTKHDETLGDN